MGESKVEELIKAYALQIPLYQKMLSLSQEQSKCLKEGNYPVLDAIADRRLGLQEEISELNARAQQMIAELVQDWGVSAFNLTVAKDRISPTQLSLLETAFERIASTIRSIQAQDDENMQVIKTQMDDIRGQFDEMNRSRQAIRAYNPVMPTEARFIDKRK